MATIPYTVSIPKDKNEGSQYGSLLISWVGITEADVGEPFDLTKYNEKTVHLGGDDGTGGTISLEGTNVADSVDAADYVVLKDKSDGSDLTATTAGVIGAVSENPLRVRPRVTAGTTVDMFCHLLCHSNR